MGDAGLWSSRILNETCSITHERFMRDTYVRFIHSFKSGEILFWVTGNIVIYDPKNRSVVETNLPSSIGQEMCYFESLVSLNSGTPATLNGFNGLGSGLRT